MRSGSKLLTIVMLTLGSLFFSAVSVAQTSEVTIGETKFPELAWGIQEMSFEVTNNTDWLKFIIVETRVQFEGSYVNPKRVRFTNFILEPEAIIQVDPILEIPGNFGDVTITLRVWDVVDTLDEITLGTVVLEQPFQLKFPLPDAATEYFQEKITLPPLVGNAAIWDNEFTRLLVILLAEGKSLDEIAAITEADMSFVGNTAKKLVQGGFIASSQEGYLLKVPIITLDEAEKGRRLALATSENLVKRLTANLKSFPAFRDSLISIGVLSGDANNFLEGTGLLYRPYPLIASLVLWYDVGSRFIAGTQNLNVFGRSDICRPAVGKYMYFTQAGDFFNGAHYYNPAANNPGLEIQFSDAIPIVECIPGYEAKRRLVHGKDWWYEDSFKPDPFVYDSALIHTGLKHLSAGTAEVLASVANELQEIHSKYGQGEFTPGILYWFWNLTATMTLNQLVDGGVIEQPERSQYRLILKR